MLSYRSVQQSGMRGEVCDTFADGLLWRRVGELPAWLEEAETLKRDGGRAVLRLRPGADIPDLVAKWFPATSAAARFKQLCRVERPIRIHRRLRLLPEDTVPVPPSLGWVALAGRGTAWLSPLVGGRSLLHWAGSALPPEHEDQSQLLFPAIEAMVSLHRAGFTHGDFKWGNILCEEAGQRYWLVDVDNIQRVAHQDLHRRQGRDLARFVLDCEEAGVAPVVTERLCHHYQMLSGCDPVRLAKLVEKLLHRLRRRHEARYGAGHRLRPPPSS